ncbi:MAG: hypothetical protein ACI81R_003211 [Bradymonadia bacterium]
MSARALCIATACAILLFARPATARPVSAATTTTVEMSSGPEEFYGEVHYSFTPRLALGLDYHRYRLAEGALLQGVQPHINLLLWRNNSRRTQSNLYLTGGYGAASIGPDWTHGGGGRLGIDRESRRWMVGAWGGASAYVDGTVDPYAGVMVGLAPYLSDYNEVQAWLMVTADYMPERLTTFDVIPHIRLMYRSALLEIGASFRGAYRLNFVIDF